MIRELIKPETELETRIIQDPEFVEGAMWGKPRSGHPEGEVIYHIGEVLENVNKYSNPENREKLRLIGITHDTFKNKVNRKKPRSGENHHALIARRFSERYISDSEVLGIIELHDEAYNSWQVGNRKNWQKAQERATRLIGRLGSSINLYLAFYNCDNKTGDKSRDNFLWFQNLIKSKQAPNQE